MRPASYKEMMDQIAASKKTDLVESAKLPFTQKLALTQAASSLGEHLVLSEALSHPILEIIRLFNLALKEKVFERYALAGGLAVEYYGAPINTVDADFLVVFPERSSGLLDPSSLYAFFERNGAAHSGEYLVLHGLKFQMIPANSELDREALENAVSVLENGTPFFIVTAEYLVALKLRAWRYKDRLHVSHLLDSGLNLDQGRLARILQRRQLGDRWKQLLSERGSSG
jgi:hypothetical protein